MRRRQYDDLTGDLIVSRESANEIKTICTTSSIVKFHLDQMNKHSTNHRKTIPNPQEQLIIFI